MSTIHFPHARPTGVLTTGGMCIYDLEPMGDLCMVAGPGGTIGGFLAIERV